MTETTKPNVDPAEIAKFDSLASRWWDPAGEFRPLHDMNPVRLDWIEQHAGSLSGLRILDIGCGGGILAEGLARKGAIVTGIDLAPAPLEVARLHLLESGLEVEYLQVAAEAFAESHAAEFDVITCLEMLEHVPDPASIIRACRKMIKPDGHVFFSTLNRNPKSFLLAIVGAEYLLHLLPQGTHEYARFIRPSELDEWVSAAGLKLEALAGMQYNPLSRRFSISRNVDVNYLACCRVQ